MIDSDSVRTSTSTVSNPELKLMKKEMRGITDNRKLKAYILEHDEELAGVPVELINLWHNCEGYKVFKYRGILSVRRKEDSPYRKNTALKSEIDRLKSDVDKLIAAVTKMDSVFNAVVQLNQLRVPE
jgi:hypothetical protein